MLLQEMEIMMFLHCLGNNYAVGLWFHLRNSLNVRHRRRDSAVPLRSHTNLLTHRNRAKLTSALPT